MCSAAPRLLNVTVSITTIRTGHEHDLPTLVTSHQILVHAATWLTCTLSLLSLDSSVGESAGVMNES